MAASTGRLSKGRRQREDYFRLDRLSNSLDAFPLINRSDAVDSCRGNGSPPSRLASKNVGYLFHTTFVMLTVFAFAGAMHHAAFVTRLSGSHGSSKISSHNRVTSLGGMMSMTSRKLPSNKHVGSLWMSSRSSTSDTEVERDGKSGFDDEDEWRTILAAFQMYKAAYGDLKVPSRFVVPAMAPWPGEIFFIKFYALFIMMIYCRVKCIHF